MRMRRAMLVIGGFLGMTSCLNLDNPEDIPLAITLELSDAIVPLDGTVQITIRAQNVGSDPITLSGPGDCLVFFQAFSASGARVYSSADFCVDAATTRVLGPGENFALTKEWDGRSSTGTRLVSGAYLLRAGAALPGSAVLGSAETINVE